MHSSSGSHPDPFSTLHSQRRGHSSGSAKKNNLCSTRSNEFVHTRQCIIVILRVDELLYSTWCLPEEGRFLWHLWCGYSTLKSIQTHMPLWHSLRPWVQLVGSLSSLHLLKSKATIIYWSKRRRKWIFSFFHTAVTSTAHIRLHIHTG